MDQNDKELADLSNDPVEGFLRNEALSRFPVEWRMPLHLFDWKPASERLKSTSNLSEEEYERRLLRDMDADTERDPSTDEEAATYGRRREKMVTEVWDQLSRFYERQGYEALHALQESLEAREEAEQEKIEVHRQRHNYLSCLKAVLNSVSHGENPELKTLLENSPEGRTTWSEAKRADEVQVRLNESELSERGVNVDNLKSYPWHVKKNATVGEVIKEVSARMRQKKRQILDWGDTLKLIYLRRKLLARKIWLIDMGISHRVPPEPFVVPGEMRRKQKPIKYCLMILSVMDEIEDEIEEGWPSQRALANILERNYDFDRIAVQPLSAVSSAGDFIKQERSTHYQEFRPDFYHQLKIDSGYLGYLAEELDIDLPERAR